MALMSKLEVHHLSSGAGSHFALIGWLRRRRLRVALLPKWDWAHHVPFGKRQESHAAYLPWITTKAESAPLKLAADGLMTGSGIGTANSTAKDEERGESEAAARALEASLLQERAAGEAMVPEGPSVEALELTPTAVGRRRPEPLTKDFEGEEAAEQATSFKPAMLGTLAGRFFEANAREGEPGGTFCRPGAAEKITARKRVEVGRNRMQKQRKWHGDQEIELCQISHTSASTPNKQIADPQVKAESKPNPTSPSARISQKGRETRMAAIETALREEQESAEATVNKAKEDWDAIDGNVHAAFDILHAVYTSPRSTGVFDTPTRRNRVARADQSSPSPSPTRFAAMPSTLTKARIAVASRAASPAIVPGGQLELPPKAPKIFKSVPQKEGLVDEAEKMFYMLFDGIDHSHGVFTTYRTDSEAPGIEEHVKGYKDAVFKGFHCCIAMLDQKQIYIVIQGVKPGVYCRRGLLMKEGLLWRGSVAMSAVGTAAQGHVVFNQWQNDGKVSFIPGKNGKEEALDSQKRKMKKRLTFVGSNMNRGFA
ncbi:hypothetical protein BT96DRAFT_945547 [Gymnopus androsaceus JB14]|uniref:Uncharacterized protein n=1 Tax=Gymnopus androsaceus JB14 TaxID=1447944 RepID=A0A6A4H1G0_9AGAR|nr:hypothetical protein BT96DRAFT_945547 [Gymnopus androsaceus JB14]